VTTISSKEQKRLALIQKGEALFAYERELYQRGARYVIGIDEVGRGALAGPVTAAAVILGPRWDPSCAPGLDDSKKLSAKRRFELADQLAECAQSSIAHVDANIIDERGIMTALYQAMRLAVEGLETQLGFSLSADDKVLIDGLPIGLFPQEEAIVKGDGKIACIAAASILAKVARDNLMHSAADSHPAYGFDSNKGYGSSQHQDALAQKGLSQLHRRTFCRNFLQDTLF